MPTLTHHAMTAAPTPDNAASQEPVRTPTDPDTAPQVGPPAPLDRSPRSLTVLLAKTAERLRTDPDVNFADGAVTAAARILNDRLDERFATGPGRRRTPRLMQHLRDLTPKGRRRTERP
jgi:hypothetical protein